MTGRLAMDIGAHNGDDTAHLVAAGWSVLALEANPILSDRLRHRFREEIKLGSVEVVAAGVHRMSGTARFFISSSDELSSFDFDRATAWGATVTEVDVPVKTLADLADAYGRPDLVKIDIEGLDSVCIDALVSGAIRPKHISLELGWDGPFVLRQLEAVGYRHFKIINQRGHKSVRLITLALGRWRESQPDHTSGPLGEASDGRWMSQKEAFVTICLVTARRAWRKEPLWHDLHASL